MKNKGKDLIISLVALQLGVLYIFFKDNYKMFNEEIQNF